MKRLRPYSSALAWAALALLVLAVSGVEVSISDPQLRRSIGERAQLAPDVWVPVFRFSSRTVMDVSASDDLRVLGFGLFDAETEAEAALVAEEGWTVSLGWLALLMAVVEAALARAFRGREEKLTRPLVRAAGTFLVIWSIYGHEPFWDWLLHAIFPRSPELLYNTNTLISLAGQHLELVLVSSMITIVTGLTIGILVTRPDFREFLPLVSDVVNSGQTVPTLAIIAIMAPIIGFGFWPAIVALILYGLLPIVRNTIVGLENVDPPIMDAARGMGLTAGQILWQIEIPSASRIILAGVRTSVVINVGTAALGAYVGSGGLGNPIASGLSQSIDAWVMLGAFAAALLAILLDYVLGRVEFVLTPKGLQIEQ